MSQAAIFYTPEAFSLPEARIYGRRAAGASFLPAYLRHAAGDGFAAFAHTAAEGDHFVERVHALRPDARASYGLPWRLGPVEASGTLFAFEPRLSPHAWRRHARGARRYSLCGLTHTIGGHAAMDAIADLPLAPLHPWDALICTSRAVKAAVDGVIDAREAYLAERFGPVRAPRVQTPVLPLGVDTAAFAATPERRAALRARLDLPEAALVVLSLGRQSLHGKANPLPLFMALEEAAAESGAFPHLVLAGWFPNQAQERLFRAQAALLAPSVTLHVVESPSAETVRDGLSGADIFVNLADNVQESFGLTVVEAMAAGLPTLVSDWNGLRDTVEHGVQGFRISTLLPPGGAGADLALRHDEGMDDYDGFIGGASQFAAVDIGAAANAFAALFKDAGLRRRMGEAGLARARRFYDWGAVIPQYQALWAELAQRRAASAPVRAGTQPSRPDPFTAFAAYPTRALAAADRVSRGSASAAGAGASLLQTAAGAPVPELLPTAAELEAVLAGVPASGWVSAEASVSVVSPERRVLAFRALAWLAKFGLIRITSG